MADTDTAAQFNIRNKARERKDKISEYIWDLLMPQTEGFEHVNMDMTFTYLDRWDLFFVDLKAMSITMTKLYGLKQSEYLLRGQLAAFLNSRRSKDAKSMDILTTIVTDTKQTFVDKTEKKQGFSLFKFGKKKE